MVPLNLTCLHCLQHSFFEHLFNFDDYYSESVQKSVVEEIIVHSSITKLIETTCIVLAGSTSTLY